MYVLIRTAERNGTVRVSTAYGFFNSTKDILKLVPKHYEKKAKPSFEATSIMTLYVAASTDDEEGKLDVALTLDRTKMWDSNVVNGSSSCYEFIGMVPQLEGKTSIAMRYLPCPCEYCVDCRFEFCSNRDIVGTPTFHEMKLKPPVECMEELVEPLTQYTVAILKLFIKNQGSKLPKCQNKLSLINYISQTFSNFVIRQRANEVVI